MRKSNKLEPLSSYEEDGIWMSYRYCIGRRSITSHSRAGDILKFYYNRLKLTPDRCMFMSNDINKSIEDNLRWGQLNVYFNYSIHDAVNPLDTVLDVISDNKGIICEDNLRHVSKIKIDVQDYGNVISSIETSDTKNLHYPICELEDLIVWGNCAKILNLEGHKVCKTIYNGKTEYIEYVNMTFIEMLDVRKYRVVNKKVPVDKYVNNSAVETYINEEYIVEDNLPLNMIE